MTKIEGGLQKVADFMPQTNNFQTKFLYNAANSILGDNRSVIHRNTTHNIWCHGDDCLAAPKEKVIKNSPLFKYL